MTDPWSYPQYSSIYKMYWKLRGRGRRRSRNMINDQWDTIILPGLYRSLYKTMPNFAKVFFSYYPMEKTRSGIHFLNNVSSFIMLNQQYAATLAVKDKLTGKLKK